MYQSLFPDYIPIEGLRSQLEAKRLLEALREVGLEVLTAFGGRQAVVKRLQEEGVTDLWHLLQIARDDVADWAGVGTAFLQVFDEMREEVARRPAYWVQEWHDLWEEHQFPLPPPAALDDFDLFGQVAEAALDYGAGATEETTLAARIEEVERAFAEAIRLYQCRVPESADVLRRYFFEGQSRAMVERLEGLRPMALHRIAFQHFVEPLMRGEKVVGLEFTPAFRDELAALTTDLLFAPVDVLNGLEQLNAPRFLDWLGLRVMQRSLAETLWATDMIVPRYEVLRARRLLQQTLAFLQWQPTFTPRKEMERLLRPPHKHWCKALLRWHPWIVHHAHGYRLRSEQLSYDLCRVARVLYDERVPMQKKDILTAYEHRYLERPQALSLRAVRRHFPEVISPLRGWWQWKADVASVASEELPQYDLFGQLMR